MKIAVEGCAHGELEKIYECIETLQEREGITVDLLICCGDFQSVRNGNDLRTMAVPEKYYNMCTFHKYYSGELHAPILTIFIGGNHEASNYLQELPYGGWVAPNIYYMGRASIIRIGDLRIGGMSGIFKGRDYLQGLWESPPYDRNSLRSVYHVRSLDVFRLKQLKEKVHVMLSHDWPRGITDYGDVETLLKRKPFFREEIESNQLGSRPAEQLLHCLKPDYWFAAHMHCQFAALVKHEEDNTETKFLALDKCLPKRRHLQILDIPPEYDGDKLLKYDAEWLAILKTTNHLLTVKNVDCHLPGPGSNERYDFTPTPDEKETVIRLMGVMTINKDDFVRTAPVYQPNAPKRAPTDAIMNPQTVNLCEKLGIDDPLQVVLARSGRAMKEPCASPPSQSVNTPRPDGTSGGLANQPSATLSSTPEFVQRPIVNTPNRSFKMSLPTPMTPIVNDSEEIPLNSSLLSPETTFLSDSTCSTTVECSTPISEVPKRTFKRRNIALYSSDADDSVSTTSSFTTDSSNKLPCKDIVIK